MTNIISLARYRHARYPDPSRGGNCLLSAAIAAIPGAMFYILLWTWL
jgi:hypothetical protein